MRIVLLLGLLVGSVLGCSRPAPTAVVRARPAQATLATGPRWVVIKAGGLDCATCAADLKADLEQQPGLTQIETFAPAPYCRFHVEDGQLDVPQLLGELQRKHSALDGYSFVRGG
jgi:hypothetical protein